MGLLANPWGVCGLAADSCGIDAERQPDAPGHFLVTGEKLGNHFNAVHYCIPAQKCRCLASHVGIWRGLRAGGSPSNETWKHNPQIILNVSGAEAELIVQLRYEHEPRLAG